jgi:hypothetical protein
MRQHQSAKSPWTKQASLPTSGAQDYLGQLKEALRMKLIGRKSTEAIHTSCRENMEVRWAE